MNKIWSFYNENELLTSQEQRVQEKQQQMSVGFWIGFGTCVVLFNIFIFF